jgi:hypothetical protein
MPSGPLPVAVETSQCDEEGNALPVTLGKCDKGGVIPSPLYQLYLQMSILVCTIP